MNMVGQERTSKVYENKYFPRAGDFRGKALSFGVLDWKQFEKWKDPNTADALELDLSTGVVKTWEQDHQPLSRKQKEHRANLVEKEDSLDQKIPSKKGRDASPNRRFSFSFSSKESSSSVPASHAPLTLNPRPATTVHALLQFTLRKGINLFQFVVENNNNVLAATMKSSDSCTRSYALYSVQQVTKKSDSWLGGRHRNEDKNHPFAHTVIGRMKTVTCITSDLARTSRSESILFGVETNEELAAIVQTSSTTTIIFPTGAHTLPKDGNAPLPLIERWKSGGACDCGGWDIGCKLRVLYCTTKPHTFSSFQLFEQERDQPAFKMVTHGDELHSVEFGSTISLLEAFFISLAVSSHQSWCEVLIGNAPLKRETPARYASNPPVSPIGRV